MKAYTLRSARDVIRKKYTHVSIGDKETVRLLMRLMPVAGQREFVRAPSDFEKISQIRHPSRIPHFSSRDFYGRKSCKNKKKKIQSYEVGRIEISNR